MLAELLNWYASTSSLTKGLVWAQVASTVVGAYLLAYYGVMAWFVAHRPRDKWPRSVARDVSGPEGTWVIAAVGVALLIPFVGSAMLSMVIFNGCLLSIHEAVLWACKKFGWNPPFWIH